jgi:4-hydroxy-tetrahydrodipicolinate reductase
MIHLVICGAAGRMGQEIIKAIAVSDDLDTRAGVEVSGHVMVGKKMGNVQISDRLESVVSDCDCVVDFTDHQAVLMNMDISSKNHKPFVTGVTGLTKEEKEIMVQHSQQIPIFYAPNMSLGVNQLYDLVERTASALRDFDIEIIETHHKAKKDAPSGTAKAIAEIIAKVKKDAKFIYGREGIVGERSDDEVCINSVRGGDIAGEHRVLYLGKGEFIELRHYATSRQCFVAGILSAVRFIIGKIPGLYTMTDLLEQRG